MNINPAYMDLPLMRLPIPNNPDAKPFRADAVGDFAGGLIDEMQASRAAIIDLGEDSPVKLNVQVADIWFDLNADGKRDAEHDVSLVDFSFRMVRGGFAPEDEVGTLPNVTFDIADRSWLIAYTHLLESFGDIVLAYDPTQAIEVIFATNAKLAELNQGLEMGNAMDLQFGSFIDGFAAVQGALDQQPDRVRISAAHDNLLAMVQANRDFWRLVKLETDNDAEWIPNDNQTAALGFDLPKGAGDTWMAVLEDGEKLLDGELLIPYWRLGTGAGLNVKTMFENPPAVDLMGWVQGRAAMPYAERGERMSAENWWRFEQMMSGQGMIFAFLLN
ncbi:MAG: hypothetical protein ABI459_06390, partial [Deltaproteobacteria bacterium]